MYPRIRDMLYVYDQHFAMAFKRPLVDTIYGHFTRCYTCKTVIDVALARTSNYVNVNIAYARTWI